MSQFLEEMEAAIPYLRRYARALTGCQAAADDLVQDTLERALRKQRLWQPTGPLRAWLFTLLNNIYRNDLRSRRGKPQLVALDETTGDMPVPPEQPDRLALAETARALALLPDEQRQVLLLVGLEGFAYEEAAAILDIPVGTVMSRLSRARAGLRKLTGETGTSHLRSVK